MTAGARLRMGLTALALLAGCGERQGSVCRAPAQGGSLILATTLGTEPYTHSDSTGAPVGIDIEIAKAAASRLGLPLEIRPMNFVRVLASVKSGETDFAASAITITPARAHDVDFSIPYGFDGSAFLYRTGKTVPTVPTAFQLRVGAQTASFSLFFLCRCGLNAVCMENYDMLLDLFEKDLLDTIFFDAAALRKTAAASGGRYAVSPLVTRENYGVAVRKDYPELLEAVNAVIRERKAKP